MGPFRTLNPRPETPEKPLSLNPGTLGVKGDIVDNQDSAFNFLRWLPRPGPREPARRRIFNFEAIAPQASQFRDGALLRDSQTCLWATVMKLRRVTKLLGSTKADLHSL